MLQNGREKIERDFAYILICSLCGGVIHSHHRLEEIKDGEFHCVTRNYFIPTLLDDQVEGLCKEVWLSESVWLIEGAENLALGQGYRFRKTEATLKGVGSPVPVFQLTKGEFPKNSRWKKIFRK